MANDENSGFKQFPINCPEAHKTYGGKKVAIKVRIDGEIKIFLAEFVVRQFDAKGPQYVSAHVNGRLYFDDPPNTSGWAFHLSEGHFASIVPVIDEKGEIEFLIQEEFRRHPPR